jgi:hypothetical protein
MKLKKPVDSELNNEVLFGNLFLYGFILILMNILRVNFIGVVIVLTIWLYIYGNIYKNVTNDFIKYLLFLHLLFF